MCLRHIVLSLYLLFDLLNNIICVIDLAIDEMVKVKQTLVISFLVCVLCVWSSWCSVVNNVMLMWWCGNDADWKFLCYLVAARKTHDLPSVHYAGAWGVLMQQ